MLCSYYALATNSVHCGMENCFLVRQSWPFVLIWCKFYCFLITWAINMSTVDDVAYIMIIHETIFEMCVNDDRKHAFTVTIRNCLYTPVALVSQDTFWRTAVMSRLTPANGIYCGNVRTLNPVPYQIDHSLDLILPFLKIIFSNVQTYSI